MPGEPKTFEISLNDKIYKGTAEELALELSQVIETASDILAVANSLGSLCFTVDPKIQRQQKITEVLTPIIEKLALGDIIRNGSNLIFLLQQNEFTFSQALKNKFFEKTKNCLKDIIQDEIQLQNLLLSLTPEQCREACEMVIAQDSRIILNMNIFLMPFITVPEKLAAICKGMKNFLTEKIREVADLNDLNKVLSDSIAARSLDPEQRAAVCEAILDHLPSLIKKKGDFAQVTTLLTQDQKERFSGQCAKRAVNIFFEGKEEAFFNNSYSFWYGKNPQQVTLSALIAHAKGENKAGFFGQKNNGGNTCKHFKECFGITKKMLDDTSNDAITNIMLGILTASRPNPQTSNSPTHSR